MILPSVLLLLLAPILVSVIVKNITPGRVSALLLLPAVGAFLILLTQVLPGVIQGSSPTWTSSWMPSIGLDVDLMFSGWGTLMALLVTGVGSCIMLYCIGYEQDQEKFHRLYLLLSLFMFAMVGVTMANHLLILFLFWELTSVISYLLIGFYHEKEESRKNALQALLITGTGGLCLLAGFILLAEAGGTWKLSELITQAETVKAAQSYPYIFGLVAMGTLTKSAQFPFHLWLPNAMVAPTPISAYLHSATMVKLGVFLLGALAPVLSGTPLWQGTFMTLGLITFLLGGLYGLKSFDLKGILAGTTLAVLGVLVYLLGDGSPKAMLALAILIIAHGVYKACLFMVAGVIDKAAGTRDIRELSGIRFKMPLTTVTAFLAGLSMMGLPPFYGFIGKEYLYKSSYATHEPWINGLLILGNVLIFSLVIKVALLPFLKRKGTPPTPLKKVSKLMLISPFILGLTGVIIGSNTTLITPLTEAAVQSLTSSSTPIKIALWSGFNTPLIMSLITTAGGILLATRSSHLSALLTHPALKRMSPNITYTHIYNALLSIASWSTRLLQNGFLRNYLLTILLTTLGLIGYKLLLGGELPTLPSTLPINPVIIITSLLIIASVVCTVTAKTKLTAIISLGVIGLGIAMFYSIYSAPDLAITQILVETLTVVIFAWVIKRIGSFASYSKRSSKILDAIIATLTGAVMTLLVLKSKTLELAAPISEELSAMSYPEGKGSNVVNVILVDFRALDTLGEITVLAIASLGVWALLLTLNASSKTS